MSEELLSAMREIDGKMEYFLNENFKEIGLENLPDNLNIISNSFNNSVSGLITTNIKDEVLSYNTNILLVRDEAPDTLEENKKIDYKLIMVTYFLDKNYFFYDIKNSVIITKGESKSGK